jgi:HTH-type transcriptional regulator / antitoxin HipB
MQLVNARDLALYVRARRRELGMTQSQLAESARVSRRWLSGLEAGKPTAEFGLILKVLHALGLVLDARPEVADPAGIDLDAILREHTRGDP